RDGGRQAAPPRAQGPRRLAGARADQGARQGIQGDEPPPRPARPQVDGDCLPDGVDPARYGLDKPNIEVTVLKPDGSEVAALAVGRRDDKPTYVRSKSPPAIYAVEAKTLDDIRKAPADIPG